VIELTGQAPWRITNTSKQRLLADKAWVAETASQRMKGLLGRDGLEPGQALYISPCTSIHSFFMRFVFDAVFVAHDGRVLHIIHRMKRFRISRIVPRAAGVIELPAGVLADSATELGDKIVLEGNPGQTP
jgi:uncharacterized membrane protein (UPF0127 family)